MNKKIYLNKNCDWCLENWWDGREYITKTCSFHKDYSYQRTLKELKEEKEELRWQRVKYLLNMILPLTLLVYGIFMELGWLGGFMTAFGLMSFCFWIWALVDAEKTYKEQIKEKKKELKEFKVIIKNEKKQTKILARGDLK